MALYLIQPLLQVSQDGRPVHSHSFKNAAFYGRLEEFGVEGTQVNSFQKVLETGEGPTLGPLFQDLLHGGFPHIFYSQKSEDDLSFVD